MGFWDSVKKSPIGEAAGRVTKPIRDQIRKGSGWVEDRIGFVEDALPSVDVGIDVKVDAKVDIDSADFRVGLEAIGKGLASIGDGFERGFSELGDGIEHGLTAVGEGIEYIGIGIERGLASTSRGMEKTGLHLREGVSSFGNDLAKGLHDVSYAIYNFDPTGGLVRSILERRKDTRERIQAIFEIGDYIKSHGEPMEGDYYELRFRNESDVASALRVEVMLNLNGTEEILEFEMNQTPRPNDLFGWEQKIIIPHAVVNSNLDARAIPIPIKINTSVTENFSPVDGTRQLERKVSMDMFRITAQGKEHYVGGIGHIHPRRRLSASNKRFGINKSLKAITNNTSNDTLKLTATLSATELDEVPVHSDCPYLNAEAKLFIELDDGGKKESILVKANNAESKLEIVSRGATPYDFPAGTEFIEKLGLITERIDADDEIGDIVYVSENSTLFSQDTDFSVKLTSGTQSEEIELESPENSPGAGQLVIIRRGATPVAFLPGSKITKSKGITKSLKNPFSRDPTATYLHSRLSSGPSSGTLEGIRTKAIKLRNEERSISHKLGLRGSALPAPALNMFLDLVKDFRATSQANGNTLLKKIRTYTSLGRDSNTLFLLRIGRILNTGDVSEGPIICNAKATWTGTKSGTLITEVIPIHDLRIEHESIVPIQRPNYSTSASTIFRDWESLSIKVFMTGNWELSRSLEFQLAQAHLLDVRVIASRKGMQVDDASDVVFEKQIDINAYDLDGI